MRYGKLLILVLVLILLSSIIFGISRWPGSYQGLHFPYDGDYSGIPVVNLLPPAERTGEAYALIKAIVTGDNDVLPYLPRYLQTAIQEHRLDTAGNYRGASACLLYVDFKDFQNIQALLLEDMRAKWGAIYITKKDFLFELRGFDPDPSDNKADYGTYLRGSGVLDENGEEINYFNLIPPYNYRPSPSNIQAITHALLGGLYNMDPRVRLLALQVLEQIGEHSYMHRDVRCSMGIETVGNFDLDRPPEWLESFLSRHYQIVDIDNLRYLDLNPYKELDEFDRRISRMKLVQAIELDGSLEPHHFENMDAHLFYCLTQPVELSEGLDEEVATQRRVYSLRSNSQLFHELKVPARLWQHGLSAYYYIQYGKLVPLGYEIDDEGSVSYNGNTFWQVEETGEDGEPVNVEKSISGQHVFAMEEGLQPQYDITEEELDDISSRLRRNAIVQAKMRNIIFLFAGSLNSQNWNIKQGSSEFLINLYNSSETGDINKQIIERIEAVYDDLAFEQESEVSINE